MTDSASEPCCDPERLAAFIDGGLSPELRAVVARHLSHCAECRSTVESVADVDDRPSIDVIWRRALLAVAAGSFVAVLGYLLVRTYGTWHAGRLERLAAAMPSSARIVEPRLTGFRWAPLQRVRGGRKSSEELRIGGEAGAALRNVGDDRSTSALHAAGVAHVLKNELPQGITALKEAAVRSPGDATIWNDLSAAMYCDATARDDNAALREALVDADRAIRLDPRSPEPYFNRALIVERTGSRAEAVAAWQAYLGIDGGSAWAVEARKHLQDASHASR